MGGTYKDADLRTAAGRDAELAAVLARYDKGWFDMWRTDLYTAPKEPMPQTYEGVANFLYIQDRLIAAGPATAMRTAATAARTRDLPCRRITYCTMNDDDHTPWKTRSTYYANSFAINPVQLNPTSAPGRTSRPISAPRSWGRF